MGESSVRTVVTHQHVVTPPALEAAAKRFSRGITPETTACFIDAIANDKAARMKAVSRCAVIMLTVPEWMRAEEVNAHFGIPPNRLKRMVAERQVVAKKLDPTLKSSAVIYKVADVRKAIGKLTDYAEWLKRRPDQTTKENNNEHTHD